VNFSAVILAGGKSSRMGRDKAWLKVDGQTLLARQIALVRKFGASEVFVSGRANQDYSAFGCPVLLDKYTVAGPLAGIERGLDAARSPLLIALAVDLPEMRVSYLRQLALQCSPASGAIPTLAGEIEPLAAIYPKTTHGLAVSNLGRGIFAARDFARLCVQTGLARLIDVSAPEAHSLLNWNSPVDVLRRAGSK
jgi:molybdopterin-guanine dinucleotide biosynthesis protein A